MPLDKSHHYIFRIGSDNQHRLYWDGRTWHYEFLAGGVVFDEQTFSTETELGETLGMRGLTIHQFNIDHDFMGESYSRSVQEKLKKLQEAGIDPCPKHGLISKNMDNSCEACLNTDYWDDFKGTEG